MTDAEVIAELKESFGADALTAAQWTTVLARAVRAYSRHRPRYVLSTMATVADQEEYDAPAGARLVIDVEDYDALSDLDLSELGITQIDLSEAHGDVIVSFHEPSQVDIYRAKLDAWRRQFGAIAWQDAPGGKIHIAPRPTSAQTLAILYSADHADTTTVPDGDRDLLTWRCEIEAQQIMANLGLVAAASPTKGVALQLGPYRRDTRGLGSTVGELRKSLRQAKRDWDAAATWGAPVLKG